LFLEPKFAKELILILFKLIKKLVDGEKCKKLHFFVLYNTFFKFSFIKKNELCHKMAPNGHRSVG